MRTSRKRTGAIGTAAFGVLSCVDGSKEAKRALVTFPIPYSIVWLHPSAIALLAAVAGSCSKWFVCRAGFAQGRGLPAVVSWQLNSDCTVVSCALPSGTGLL